VTKVQKDPKYKQPSRWSRISLDEKRKNKVSKAIVKEKREEKREGGRRSIRIIVMIVIGKKFKDIGRID